MRCRLNITMNFVIYKLRQVIFLCKAFYDFIPMLFHSFDQIGRQSNI